MVFWDLNAVKSDDRVEVRPVLALRCSQGGIMTSTDCMKMSNDLLHWFVLVLAPPVDRVMTLIF